MWAMVSLSLIFFSWVKGYCDSGGPMGLSPI